MHNEFQQQSRQRIARLLGNEASDAGKTNERTPCNHCLKALAEIRRLTHARGGRTVILRAPDEIKSRIDVWGEVGPTGGLMRALKEKFDPHKLLNPGRFVAGI